MNTLNPALEDEEELDILTGARLMPNTPRDPDDPREKLKVYLKSRLGAEQQMGSPEFRQASRAPMEELQQSNRDLALSKLFNQAANQFGTIGGKAASSQGFDQYANELQKQNDQTMQGFKQDRLDAQGMDDQRFKMLEYLAGKYDARDAAAAKGARQDRMDALREREVIAKEREAGMKNAEKAESKAKEDAELNITDLDRLEGVQPSTDDAKKAKLAKVTYDRLINNLDRLQQITERSGTNLMGKDAQDQASLSTQLQLDYKTLKELGALSGPDKGMLDAVVPNPTDYRENLKDLVPGLGSNVNSRLADFRKSLDLDFESGIKAHGYRSRKPGTGGGAPTPPAAVSPRDQEALDWANANPNDPRAAKIRQKLGR